ncbi:glycosyltransferase [Thalassotalea litorea]|uniref:Glycosyltransferase n=1 Tax=Thalassotalea litorea TaxID=2020715 RepID=A0A5R9IT48_9GAMM|nr:glycosyltransferase [Thalassotalea litorea]TLU65098.1 glycosyltransferase [Thalassotalea litorea]
MKLLFVHDHPFFHSSDNQYFSGGGLPASVWDRYLKVFDTIDVVGRQGGPLPEAKINYVLSSRKGVSFFPQKNISGLRSRYKNISNATHNLTDLIDNADAIIVRLPSELGLLAVKLCKTKQKPYAVEMVDCPWDGLWNYGSFVAKLYAPLLAWRNRQAVKTSPYTLYVTKEFLQTRYPSPKSVSVNCSNVEISEISEDVLAARLQKISSSKNKVVLGQIGSLKGRFKGVHSVLSVLRKVKSQLPNFEYRILSSGSTPYYEQMVKDYGLEDVVYFDGPLPSGKPVMDWLDSIDIYLHPSFKEGLPRALIEAMSRGCPAIASNVAGIPELLNEDMMINPGDENHLELLIKRLVASETLQQRLAQENHSKSKKYHHALLDKKRTDYLKSFASFSSKCKFNP